jgi:hypothetical protein
MKKFAAMMIAVAAAALLSSCSTMGTNQYYVKNPMSQDDLISKRSHPDMIMKLDVDTEKWVYKSGMDNSDKMFFLVRNGKVMDSGIEIY